MHMELHHLQMPGIPEMIDGALGISGYLDASHISSFKGERELLEILTVNCLTLTLHHASMKAVLPLLNNVMKIKIDLTHD